MQFFFNTASVPQWTLPQVTSRAAGLGYAGVEAHLPQAAGEDPAAGSIVADRELVKLVFEQANVRLAGLSTRLQFRDGDGDDGSDAALRRVIDLAARLGCPLVRMLDTTVRPRSDPRSAALRLAEKLSPLADHAADANVTLLVQNALTFRTGPAMWHLIEQVDHPAVACAWDPLSSAAAGEDPMVAVPTLNSRIGLVLLRDATLSSPGPRTSRDVVALSRLGDGELDLGRTLDRLRGIGFAGPAVVSYPAELPEAVGPAEDLLSSAIETLKKWTPAPAAKKAGKAVA